LTVVATRLGLLALAAVLLVASNSAAADDCTALNDRSVGAARITSADSVPAGAVLDVTPMSVTTNVSFCRVRFRLETAINVELWLPGADTWNHRFLGAGVGGSAGTFNYRGLGRALNRGFAAASTDTGHSIDQKNWMLDGQAAVNYAHRAVHLMTDASKAIVKGFYGAAAKRAYFMGCSGGGREALKEMQLYPQDYDGILAGAPGPNMPLLSVRHMLSSLAQERSPAKLDARDWALVRQGAVRACGADDQAHAGVMIDPRACRFDVATLNCSSSAAPACLSAEKIALVEAIAAPAVDEHGVRLDDGLLPGVSARPGPPPTLLLELFGQGVHHDASWNPEQFIPSEDLAAVYRDFPDMRADDPNLRAFEALGHKAIVYQGWMDPSVLAQSTVAYYEKVAARAGSVRKAQEFIRLFMVPGMLHCGGGDGTDLFGGEAGSVSLDPSHDALSGLIQWVETSRAPQEIIAARMLNNEVVRTRPLCAYPLVEHYKGSGDAADAANFQCSALVTEERR
jgi:feruloyl esterase